MASGRLVALVALLGVLGCAYMVGGNVPQRAVAGEMEAVGGHARWRARVADEMKGISSAIAGNTAGQEKVAARSARRPRIAILSCYFGSSLELAPFTKPNKVAYAERHGYHFEDAMTSSEFVKARYANMTTERDHKFAGRQPSGAGTDQSDGYIVMLFMKLEILSYYLSLWRNRFDWIFWADADALFLNFSESLEQHVESLKPVVNLVIPSGPATSPKWSKVLNTGHLFLRVDPWSRHLMQATLRHSREPCDLDIPRFNGWLSPCLTVCCVWGDQGALMQVLMKHPLYLRHVRLTGFRDFGSQFPWYAEGDLVVHLPGLTLEARIPILRTLLNAVNFEDGTFTRAVPVAMQPQRSPDHARGMDYTFLNNLTTWQYDNQHLAESLPQAREVPLGG